LSEEIDKIKKLLTQGVQNRRRLVAETELNLAFINGNQWCSWNSSQGIQEITNDTNEFRVTDNKLLPLYVWRQSYLFKSKPVLTTFAGGQELQDSESAKVASSICDYVNENCGWLEKQKEVQRWVDVSGTCFIAPVWRKNALGKKVKKSIITEEYEKKGKKTNIAEVETVIFNEDIGFDVFPVTQTYTFPSRANTWDKVTKIITADIATREWIENMIGEELPSDIRAMDDDELNLNAIENSNKMTIDNYGLVYTENTDDEDRYMVIQYRERPTFKYPNGRFMLIVGDELISSTDLPMVDYAREVDPVDTHNLTMGLVPHFGTKTASSLFPKPLFSNLRESQKRYNELRTDEYQNRKAVGRNKLIVGKDMIEEDEWTNEHGQIIEVGGASSVAPQLIRGEVLQGIGEEIAREGFALDEASGRNELLKGHNPPNARSAFQLDILIENSTTIIDGDITEREQVFGKVGKLVLAMVKKNYDNQRIIQIVGEDIAGLALGFKESCILTDLRVKEGSAKVRNHAGQEAKIVELLQYGAFAKADGTQDMESVWTMLEMGSMNRNVNHKHKHRTRANKENYIMMYGLDDDDTDSRLIKPMNNEEHEIHLEEHLGFMARPEFYKASEVVQAIMLAHLQEHKDLIQVSVAPQTMEDESGLLLDEQEMDMAEEEEMAMLEEEMMAEEQQGQQMTEEEFNSLSPEEQEMIMNNGGLPPEDGLSPEELSAVMNVANPAGRGI